MKKKTCLLFSLIILFTVMFVTQLEAGWGYQRPITIGSTGTALTDYQVLVTLTDFDGDFYTKSEGDAGDDLRFSTDATGSSEPDVDYWIEEWNEGGTSKVWIEVPSIPASDGTTIYMYYGNTAASAASNGDATSLFFDDFNDGTYANKWTVQQSGWGVGWVEQNGYFANYCGDDLITLDSPLSAPGKAIRSKVLETQPWRDPIMIIGWQDNDNYYFLQLETGHANTTDGIHLIKRVESSETTLASGTDLKNLSQGVWYRWELRWVSSTQLSAEFWDSDGTSLYTITGSISEGWESGNYGFRGKSGVSATRFDDALGRKYISSEPTASVCSETAPSDYSLPVELSVFTAQYLNNVPTLYWQTQSETNNAGWNIYRGETNEALSNEEAFLLNLSLGLIPGAGTTSEPTEYSFEDLFPVYAGNTYFYWLESVDYSGETELHGPISLTIPEDEWENPNSPEIPKPYGLHQNYPNPFNPNTEISFMMKESCIGELSIFNIKGQKIKTIFTNSSIPRDELIISIWNGKDESEKEVSSGVYLYELKTNKEIYLKRMLLIK